MTGEFTDVGSPAVGTEAGSDGTAFAMDPVTRASQIKDFVQGVEQRLRVACFDAVHVRQDAEEDLQDPTLSIAYPIRVATEEHWHRARRLALDRAAHPQDQIRLENLATRLQFEKDAWILIERVYGPRAFSQPHDLVSGLAGLDGIPADLNHFPNLRRCRILLEWLEVCEAACLDLEGGPSLAPFDDPAYQWAYSAEKLGRGAMDMDQPLRVVGPRSLGVKLENIEEMAEERINCAVFRLVRAGRLAAAQDLCRRINQHWRAASLGGSGSIWDFSCEGIRGGARKTWREVARTIAASRGSRMQAHERATYGVLSGVLEPILAVCSCFEDRVWARLCILVDGKIDSLAEAIQTDTPLSCVPDITDEEITEVLYQSVASQTSVEPHQEAVVGELNYMARRAIMLVGLGNVMQSGNAAFLIQCLTHLSQPKLAEEDQVTDPWSPRFAAHLALFLKYWASFSNISEGFEPLHAIVKNFCLHLVKANRAVERVSKAALDVQPIFYDMIAQYAAEISEADIIDVFATCMKEALYADVALSIPGRHVDVRRSICLATAGKHFSRGGRGLLGRLTYEAVWLIWSECIEAGEEEGTAEDDTEKDHAIIAAIDFFVYPGFEDQGESLVYCTSAARYFCLREKSISLRGLLAVVERNESIVGFVPGEQHLTYRHELDCWMAYMRAIIAHHRWNQFVLGQKPVAPTERQISEATAAPGEVPYDVQAAANIVLHGYKTNLKRFQSEVAVRRRQAVDTLRATLCYDGGWMCDIQDSEASNSTREEQLAEVRKQKVPLLVAMLSNIYASSQMHQDVMEVSNLVACDRYRLYREFGDADLESFLRQVAESSILFMQQKIDDENITRPYKNQIFEEME